MYKLFILVHVIAGTTALITGAVAMFSAKGKKQHNRFGKFYEIAMYVNTLFAITATLIKFNPFFLAIGIFSFYLVYNGARSINFWRLKETYSVTIWDKLKCFGFLGLGLYMVGSPLFKMIAKGSISFSVLMFFGVIMLISALQDLRNFNKPELFKPRQKYWLIRHIGMMGGSYISAFTAFAVNNMLFEQGWIMWILPTLVGTVLITRASNKWRKKLGMATSILVLPLFLNAQSSELSKITGTVLSKDSLPVAFANIGLKGTSIGTISDESGNFSLYAPKGALNKKKVAVSHVSFVAKEFEINETSFNHPIKIVLAPNILELSEVVITAKEWQQKVYGFNKTTTILKNNLALKNYPNQNLGSAVGRKFSMGKKEHKIEQVKFYINQNNFDTAVIRLSITKIEKGVPGQPLHKEPVIFLLTNQKAGWITVDVSHKNIYAKNDVAVTIEWIKQSKKGSYLSLPITMPIPGVTHYYRFGSQNNWEVYPTMTTAIQLITLKEKY